jgi:hypothetical protein
MCLHPSHYFYFKMAMTCEKDAKESQNRRARSAALYHHPGDRAAENIFSCFKTGINPYYARRIPLSTLDPRRYR